MSPACLAASLAVLLLTGAAAQAQDMTLRGQCGKLVIADQDVTAACKGSVLKLVSPSFASFAFAADDGRTLSFIGGGIREADGRTELPVTLVASGLSTKEGISRSTTPGAGSCRISRSEPDSTVIACEATAQGKRYAGTFAGSDKVEPSAAKP